MGTISGDRSGHESSRFSVLALCTSVDWNNSMGYLAAVVL